MYNSGICLHLEKQIISVTYTTCMKVKNRDKL
jgi:hypothetical protein